MDVFWSACAEMLPLHPTPLCHVSVHMAWHSIQTQDEQCITRAAVETFEKWK